MAVRSVEAAAAKYRRNFSGAAETVRVGVESVTEAPGKAAAAKADEWHTIMSATETKERWRKSVAAVTLPEWASAMLNVGIPRMAVGAEVGGNKWEEWYKTARPKIVAGLATLTKRGPKMSETNITRVREMAKVMNGLRRA